MEDHSYRPAGNSLQASFEQRIIAMLEGAANALLADSIRDRENAAKQRALAQLAGEVQSLAAQRSELDKEAQQLREAEARAERRVKRASRIVKRYRDAFEKIRERLSDLVEDEPASADELADHLDRIVRMIENVADLDPLKPS